MNLPNSLIILDNSKSLRKLRFQKTEINKYCNPTFVVEEYENLFIRFSHKLKWGGSFLSHVLLWSKSFIASLKYLFTLILNRQIKVVICINPIVGFFLCLLKSFIPLKAKIVVSGFLFEPKSSVFYYNLRKNLVNFAYKNSEFLFVYSSPEVQYYSDLFPTLANKFRFVHFGIDFYHSNLSLNRETNEIVRIVSGGASNRDFSQLSLVAKELNNFDFYIATRPYVVESIKETDNLHFTFNITPENFGTFLNSGDIVVLPLKNNNVSSGHMVLLECLSIGKKVVVSDNVGIKDYIDEKHVVSYKNNNLEDLKDKILMVAGNRIWDNNQVQDTKLFYEESYTLEVMISNILKSISHGK